MSDARALLRAKRQEARISHPLATYTSSGQLRCIACDANVKHAAAWEGHIGSKSHRTHAARLREERARAAQREAEERDSLKRKAMDVDEDEAMAEEADEDAYMSGSDAKKRRVESEEPVAGSSTAGTTKKAAIPADFFSDPSMAPPPMEEDEEDGEGEGAEANGAAAAPRPASVPMDVLDLEWQQFQQSVVNAPDYRETYERATVVAEPVITEALEGFPASAADDVPEVSEKEKEMGEEARRRKRELEDRELIMDRLMEEEQAQEEADERVSLLKNKLEALKRKREAAKAAKKSKS